MSQRRFILFSVSLILTLSTLCCWQVFESDLFYLLRAGEHMLATGEFLKTELWSFTAHGVAWDNHQWLSEIIFSFWEKAAGVETLPVFRFLLTCSILGFASAVVARQQFRVSSVFLWILFLFTVIWPRIQLRSELLVFVVFSLQIYLSSSPRTLSKNILFHSSLILLWSQLHTGTAWIGALYAMAVLLEDEKNRSLQRVSLIFSLPALMLFLNPLGWKFLDILWVHAALQGNIELQSLSWSLLNPLREGGTFLAAYVGLAFLSWDLFKNRKRPTMIFYLLLLLAVISVFRVRVLPFMALAMLPLLAQLTFRKWISYVGQAVLVVGLVWMFAGLPRSWGLGIDTKQLPVAAADFIKQNRIHGNMLNHYNFGSYFVWALPKNPVALDGRETPFLKFEQEMIAAAASASQWKAFLDSHNISFVVDITPDESKASFYRSYFPPSLWAAIYADDQAVILVRRSPETAELIQAKEIPF